MPDADIAAAVETLVDGAFFNSGQCCCAIERIYVHQEVYQDFVDGAASLTSAYVLGNPLDPETTLGPMARARDADFVRAEIDKALAAGATPLIDISRFDADEKGTAYLAPQVLVDVNHEMSIMRDETFGPVVGIMPVKDDAEALALVNDSPYGSRRLCGLATRSGLCG